MSFTERGGGWVLAQLALFALYVVALVGTSGMTEGMALGYARLMGVVLVVAGVVLAVTATEPVIRVGTAFLAGEATAMALLSIVGTLVHWRDRA